MAAGDPPERPGGGIEAPKLVHRPAQGLPIDQGDEDPGIIGALEGTQHAFDNPHRIEPHGVGLVQSPDVKREAWWSCVAAHQAPPGTSPRASMTLTCAATMRQPCANRTQVCIWRPTWPARVWR